MSALRILLPLLFACGVQSQTLTSISPSSGSTAGGTRVLIEGSGFSDNNNAAGNVVTIDGAPCEVVPLHSTTNQIVCKTTAHAAASNLVVEVTVDGVYDASGTIKFSYKNSDTPWVSALSPTSGPAGTMLTISGADFNGDAVEDLLVPNFEVPPLVVTLEDQSVPANNAPMGVPGTLCSLVDDDLEEPFGASDSQLVCEVGGPREAGFHNVTVTQTSGSADVSLDALHVNSYGEVFMFEYVAVVDRVEPAAGSQRGGTLLTITGSGFADDTTAVFVGDVPCEVLELTLEQIQCRLALADETPAAPFAGLRGVTSQTWDLGSSGALSALYALDDYPDAPASTEVLGDFQAPSDYSSYFGSRLRAFFTAPFDSNYTFYVASDDYSDLTLDGELIAQVEGHTNDLQFDKYASQQAAPVALAAGERVLLEANYAEGTGGDNLAVGVKIHSPGDVLLNSDVTSDAVDEEQVVTAAVAVEREVQRIVLVEQAAQPAAQLLRVDAHANSSAELTVAGTTMPVAAWTVDALAAAAGAASAARVAGDDVFAEYELTFDEDAPVVSASISTQTATATVVDDRVVLSSPEVVFQLSLGDLTTSPLPGTISPGLLAVAVEAELGVAATVSSNHTLTFSDPTTTVEASIVAPAVQAAVTQLAVPAANLTGSFALSMGGRTSAQLPVDASAAEVQAALRALHAAECAVSLNDSAPGVLFDLDTFELTRDDADTEDWASRNGIDPVIAYNDSMCGYASSYFPHSFGLNRLPSPGVFDTDEFPWLCMSYRIPAGVPTNMLLHVSEADDEESFVYRSVAMTNGESPIWYAAVASWGAVVDDDEWHHACINLDEQLDASMGEDATHWVDQVRFFSAETYYDRYDEIQPFWVDEFSISAEPRYVARTADFPEGPRFADIAVADEADGSGWSVTFTPFECDTDVPLMTVDTAAAAGFSDAFVERVVQHSAPLGGSFTLAGSSASIAFDASADDVAAALGGDVAVTRSGTCEAYQWTVTFTAEPGDVPLLEADGAGLTGLDASLTVHEHEAGGLFFAPVRGELLQRALDDEPQVVVKVAGHPGACGDNCTFVFDAAATPVVSAVNASVVRAGDVVRLEGDLLDDDVTVWIGGVECAVVAPQTCVVGEAAAGDLVVLVEGLGYADVSQVALEAALVVEAVSPAEGSLEGGTELLISGAGFFGDVNVTVGGVECALLSVAYDAIECVTGASAESPADVVVSGAALAAGFDFAAHFTPAVDGVEPASVSAGAQESLFLEGSGLAADAEVFVGGEPCAVLNASATDVECRLPVLEPGSHAVSVLVPGAGFAAVSFTLEAVFAVDAVAPDAGLSVAGGAALTATGAGFVANNTAVAVEVRHPEVHTLSLRTDPVAHEVQTIAATAVVVDEVQVVTLAGAHGHEVQRVALEADDAEQHEVQLLALLLPELLASYSLDGVAFAVDEAPAGAELVANHTWEITYDSLDDEPLPLLEVALLEPHVVEEAGEGCAPGSAPGGNVSTNATCEPCAAGEFKDFWGDAECELCPAHDSESAANGTWCECATPGSVFDGEQCVAYAALVEQQPGRRSLDGSFALDLGACATAAVPAEASAAELQAALEAVPGVREVAVERAAYSTEQGRVGVEWTVTFLDVDSLCSSSSSSSTRRLQTNETETETTEVIFNPLRVALAPSAEPNATDDLLAVMDAVFGAVRVQRIEDADEDLLLFLGDDFAVLDTADDGRPTAAQVRDADDVVRALRWGWTGADADIDTATERGHAVERVTSPLAAAAARAHFGCDELAGAELAADGSGDWAQRVFGPDQPWLHAVELARLADTDWYEVDLSAAAELSWGRDAGCAFATDACIDANQEPSFPHFCATAGQAGCSADRTAKATCDLALHDAADIPSYFQYFGSAEVGGAAAMDYCPVFVASADDACDDDERCFLANDAAGERPQCLKFECFGDVLVVNGDDECPAAGGYSANGVLCPAWAELCEESAAALAECFNDCSGAGECVDGICVCHDGADGADCSREACPDDCHADEGLGVCDGDVCHCYEPFTDDACVPLLTFSGDVPLLAVAVEDVEGVDVAAAVEELAAGAEPLGGEFALQVGLEATVGLAAGANEYVVRQALEALDGVDSAVVSREPTEAAGYVYSITFTDERGDRALMLVDSSALSGTNATVSVLEAVRGSALGGSWTLGGAELAHDASAAAVAAALGGADDIEVTAEAVDGGFEWTVTMLDRQVEHALLDVDGAGLTGTGAAVATTQTVAGTVALSGSFELAPGVSVAADASAEDVAAAVAAAVADASDVRVSRAVDVDGWRLDQIYPYVWTVTFARASAALDDRWRCTDATKLDWAPEACPDTAALLWLAHNPGYAPLDWDDDDIGDADELQAACDAEAERLLFRVLPECLADIPDNLLSDSVEVDGVGVYTRDDSAAPTLYAPGYRYFSLLSEDEDEEVVFEIDTASLVGSGAAVTAERQRQAFALPFEAADVEVQSDSTLTFSSPSVEGGFWRYADLVGEPLAFWALDGAAAGGLIGDDLDAAPAQTTPGFSRLDYGLAAELAAGEVLRAEGVPAPSADAFGLDLWVRPAAGAANATVMNYAGFAVGLDADGNWGAELAGHATLASQEAAAVDVWQHVALSCSASACFLAVDGESVAATTTATTMSPAFDTVGVAFGSAHFSGAIDEATVYASTLSADDAASHAAYNADAEVHVVVTVEGVLTAEAAVSVSPSVTPVIDAIEPAEGADGDSVTLTGRGLSGATVALGGVACAVTADSDTELTCTVGARDTAGAVDAVVSVPGVGASPAAAFEYLSVVDDVSPTTGSLEGGTLVSIVGRGLANAGVIDGCAVETNTATLIECRMDASPGDGGEQSVSVSVLGAVAFEFAYAEAATPTVDAATPTEVPAGTTVTLTGTQLAGASEVLVGDACTIVSAAADEVTCTLDVAEGGSHAVSVLVDGLGYARVAESVGELRVPVVITAAWGDADVLYVEGSGFADADERNEFTVGGRPCEVSESTHTSLACATPPRDASGALDAWVEVEEDGDPQDWLVAGGVFEQLANEGSGTTSDDQCATHMYGSALVSGDAAWTDLSFSATINTPDDDTLGLYVRYADADNYVRFEMNREDGCRRIVQMLDGEPSVLASSSAASYSRNVDYALRVDVVGEEVAVFVDGEPDVASAAVAVPAGRVGLFTWRSLNAKFFDVDVQLGVRNSSALALVVNGVASTGDFSFDYDAFAAPVVDSAAVVEAGVVQLTGSGLEAVSDVEVGGAACSVTHNSSSQVTCELQEAVGAGWREVTARAPGRGASAAALVEVPLALSAVSPASGSFAGGTTLELTGSGLSAGETTTRVCGIDCVASGASATGLTCVTGSPVDFATPSVENTTVEATIEDGVDDVMEQLSNGAMWRETDSQWLVYSGYLAGLRFADLDIPRGARVNAAYLYATVAWESCGDTTIVVQAEAADDAAPFSTAAFDLSARALTEAAVEWEPDAWRWPDDVRQSADLTAVVDEVVNRDGWARGGALALVMSHGEDGGDAICGAATAEAGAGARLVVEFTPPNFMSLFDEETERLCDVEVASDAAGALNATLADVAPRGTASADRADGSSAAADLAVDGDEDTAWGVGSAWSLALAEPAAVAGIVVLGEGVEAIEGVPVTDMDERAAVWFSSPAVLSSVSVTGANVTLAEVQVWAAVVEAPAQASVADGFEYREDQTAVVTGVTHDSGSTAGGTEISVFGYGFGSSADGVEVDVGGVACAVTAVEDTEVTCTTGATSVLDGGWKVVTVLVPGKGFSAPLDAHYQYVDRWSAATTWGGEAPPEGCGDWADDKTCTASVVIPAGQLVLMDVSPPRFYLILVQGTLIFEDEQDLELQASYLLVQGGTLRVGTEAKPFAHRATITLFGYATMPELPIFGSKVLAVYRGTLDLHGQQRVEWTRLAATAAAGSSALQLEDPVDWEEGDYISVAPTDWDMEHAEMRVVAGVSGDGLTVTLDVPLEHEHLSEDMYSSSGDVPMRAEVGLLTRNVVVQGDSTSDNCVEVSTPGGFSCSQFGGHLFLHSPGDESLVGRIENVEVRNMGQAFRLGRYAIHFHMIGEVQQSYVRGCAVHHGHNRAVAIHGVHHLTVADNVVYSVKGHSIFIEDGIETKNVIEGNLVMMTLPSNSLLNTDQTPTSFWVTNADNVLRNNVAAGSKNYGFWYRAELSLTGTSFGTPGVCPINVPLLEFDGNTAHSNGRYGLRVFPEYYPRADGCDGGDYVTAEFRNLLSYRNGKNGVTATETGPLAFEGFVVADNLEAGFEFRKVDGDWGEARIANSLLVGRTDAAALPAEFVGRGVWGPVSHRLSVVNSTFANYDQPDSVAAMACAVCTRGGSPEADAGGFEMRFSGITRDNAPHLVHWRWKHEGLFHDLDGSFSGSGVPDTWVVTDSALLPADGRCDEPAANFSRGAVAGRLCYNSTFRRVGLNGQRPSGLEYDDLLVSVFNASDELGEDVVPWHHKPNPTHSDGYQFTVALDATYELAWDLADYEYVDIEAYTTGVSELQPEDRLRLANSLQHWRSFDVIDRPLYWADVGGETAESRNDTHGAWWFEDEADGYGGVLEYLVLGCADADLCTRDTPVEIHECPADGCWPAPPPEEVAAENSTRLWSDPATWNGTQTHLANPLNTLALNNPEELAEWQEWVGGDVPGEGDNVWVPKWLTVMLDVTPPDLGRVVIEGTLVFNDTDLELAAVTIEIKNGLLQVGSEDAPFEHRAAITLLGDRATEEVHLGAEAVDLGAKALGVFGRLELHGEPGRLAWTRLAATAAAGDSQLELEDAEHGWRVGDELVVASSDFSPHEAEVVVVAGVSGATVTLAEPLAHEHTAVDEEHGTRGMRVAAEVGLLTRNVVVQGRESSDEAFGCRILVSHYSESWDDCSLGECFVYADEYWGAARLSGVEVRECGHNGFDDRYAIEFADLGDRGADSSVNDSSVHDSYHTAVGIDGSHGVVLAGNVASGSVRGTFVVTSEGNWLERNLGLGTVHYGTFRDNDDPNEPFDTAATFEVPAQGNVLIGNAAGGSERAGFRTPGVGCAAADEWAFAGNSAHSNMFGFFAAPRSGASCMRVPDLTTWKNWNFGVYAEHITTSVELERLAVADSKVGMLVHVIGPGALTHVRVDKYVRVRDSLFVGTSAACEYDRPVDMCEAAKSHCLSNDGQQDAVWLSSFNSANNMAPVIKPWHTIGDYPAIGGHMEFDGVTFARFRLNGCGVRDRVFRNNEKSPDAQHPVLAANVELVDVEDESLAYFAPPNPAWINQDDCVDMDCDGPKHALVRDLDGSLGGSIVARAEFFNDGAYGAIPPAVMFVDADGVTYTEDEVMPNGYGIPRDGCTSMEDSWNAWRCPVDNAYSMLIIESLDADTEVRRFSPLALSADGYTDLINNPQDHTWFFGYTGLVRISTFFTLVQTGLDYEVHTTGTMPQKLRLQMLNTPDDEAVVVGLFYTTAQRLQVFVDDEFVEDLNMLDGKHKADLVAQGRLGSYTETWPSVDMAHGANAFDRTNSMLFVTVRGSAALDVRTMPVVMVSMSLAVSVEDFYEDYDNFVSNIAFVLGIDTSRITIVSVVPGSANVDFEIVPSPQVAFGADAVDASEADGYATVTVTRDTNIFGNVTVLCRTFAGTALEGVHYEPLAVELEFASAEISKQVNITLLDDGAYSAAAKQFTLLLSNATGGIVGDVATVVLSVANAQPAAPEDVALVALLADSGMTVSWTSSDDATSWDAQYRLASSDDWVDVPSLTAAEVSVTGLDVYAAYEFRARAHNDFGASEWSAESAEILSPTLCGDGAAQGAEECDDGGVEGGDGCSSSCKVEAGYSCASGVCAAGCGDGVLVDGVEECDDGNEDSYDGCSSSCVVEPGYPAVCGDGLAVEAEECDDSNTDGGDGCSAACAVEDGWTCADGVCASCGSGAVEADEECDDSNTADGDGCSATCEVEAGWVCAADCVGGPDAPPDAPLVVSVTASTATLSWSAPLNDNGLAVDGYAVEYAASGSDAWASQEADVSPFTLEGLVNSTTYDVRVLASTAAGWSAASEAAALTTLAPEEDTQVETDATADLNALVDKLIEEAPTMDGGDLIQSMAVTESVAEPEAVETGEDLTEDEIAALLEEDPDAFAADNSTVVDSDVDAGVDDVVEIVLGGGNFEFAPEVCSPVPACVTNSRWSPANYSVEQGAGAINVTVARVQGGFGSTFVSLAIGALGSEELAFAAGEYHAQVEFAVAESDGLYSGFACEVTPLVLFASADNSDILQNESFVEVVDADEAPVVSLAATEVSEWPLQVDVVRSGNLLEDLELSTGLLLPADDNVTTLAVPLTADIYGTTVTLNLSVASWGAHSGGLWAGETLVSFVAVCPDGEWLLATDECVADCGAGMYGAESGLCAACDSSCATCGGSSSSECLSCDGDLFLSGSSCVAECSAGEYGEANVCEACDESCATCDSATECLTCSGDLVLSGTDCLAECPTGTYNATLAVCEECDAACDACTGPTGDDCVECAGDAFIEGSTCVEECSEGMYEADGLCLPCDSSCATCSSSSECLSCDGDLFLSGSSCVAECSAGDYGEANVCEACDSSCATCDSATECTACDGDLFLSGTDCVAECEDGAYGTDNVCEACDESCATCAASATECTACDGDLFLSGTDCVAECEDGAYGATNVCEACDSSCASCDSASECTACDGDLFLSGTECLAECEDGAYGADNVCEACDEACATCAESATECTGCDEAESYLDDGRCVDNADGVLRATLVLDGVAAADFDEAAFVDVMAGTLGVASEAVEVTVTELRRLRRRRLLAGSLSVDVAATVPLTDAAAASGELQTAVESGALADDLAAAGMDVAVELDGEVAVSTPPDFAGFDDDDGGSGDSGSSSGGGALIIVFVVFGVVVAAAVALVVRFRRRERAAAQKVGPGFTVPVGKVAPSPGGAGAPSFQARLESAENEMLTVAPAMKAVQPPPISTEGGPEGPPLMLAAGHGQFQSASPSSRIHGPPVALLSGAPSANYSPEAERLHGPPQRKRLDPLAGGPPSPNAGGQQLPPKPTPVRMR